jgi:hypothetical protein
MRYGHLVVVWVYVLFSGFGILCREKSGNLGHESYLLAFPPCPGGADLGAHPALQGVPVAGGDKEAGPVVKDAQIAENLSRKRRDLVLKRS